ncbi:MAG: two-component regulator propeller domain-containing protein [Paludibacteraceae bacterium]
MINVQKLSGIKVIFLFLIFTYSSTVSARQSRLIFTNITNENGLTHNTVFDICQDAKGFMWFATPNGLNRYDGQNIKQYHYSEQNLSSLPSYTASCLVYTSDSILFVGTSDGLAAYTPSKDNFKRILYEDQSFGNFISMRQGVGTELLISTENKGAFIYNYKTEKLEKFDVKYKIYGIAVDAENTYWIFTRYTIYRFDKKRKLIAKYSVSNQLFGSAISYIGTDKQGNLWVGTFDNGLFKFNKYSKQFEQLPLCRKLRMYYVRTMENGEMPGDYWVGTENGIYVINILTNNYEHYTQSFDDKEKSINDNAIYKVFRNKQNFFFAATYFGGVNVANTRTIGFNAILPDDRAGFLHGKAISTIAKGTDGNLWIATEDAGIAIYDKKRHTFSHLLFNEQSPNSISSNNVHALLMDGNTCWAGHFMGGISKIDIPTKQAQRYIQQSNNPASLNNNFVFALAFYSHDSILIGTLSGVDIFDKKKQIFARFRENEFADCFVYDIFKAPDGKFWFCTYNKGIFVLDITQKGLMTHFQSGDASGLNCNAIISHCIDSKGQIWIGTKNAGLMKFNNKTGRFIPVKSNMLVDNVIYGILEDNRGFLWISTNKGISRLNTSDSTAVNFNIKQGIAGNQYNYKSYFKDDDILYFGSVTGITWFDPKTIFTPVDVPTVYFTNLKIFNKNIVSEEDDKILTKQIDFTDKLKLRYNQNSFTLEFGCVNYLNGDISYQYYLEGFDKGWSPASEMTQANYTNISPGKYEFHIRAINKMNNAQGQERTMTIKISPPFWASWFAFFLYFILAVAVGYFILQFYKNRQKEKMTLAIGKIEKENLNLLHQHKMNFFTYITP